MARDLERLHSTDIRRLGKGRHGDGGGLWLHVNDDGRYWFFRWGAGGKHTLSLGPVHTIGLSKAREKARACRELLLDGRDPKAESIAQRVAAKLKAQQLTFSQAADQYFQLHSLKWRSAKHAAEWRSSLKLYAEPVLGALPVDSITTTLVLKALEPIWVSKSQTAARVRQRVETVLDFSKARGWRNGDNPARWRGHLDQVLPRPRQIAPVVHHAALSYRDIPDLMRKLAAEAGAAARCLEFLILCAVRTNEARRAAWNEIDGEVWTVPAARMKRGKPHRVPLTRAARAVLMRLRHDAGGDGYIFRGRLQSSPFAFVALGKLAKRLSADAGLTVHGFRSSFRDWAAEQTNFSREAAEIALAHAVGSETERAYQRGDMLEQRRQLMEAWAAFCLPLARSRTFRA